jgi:hypothetical protein
MQMLQWGKGSPLSCLIDGIDLVQAIVMSQIQMLLTLDEIERQANVGIGYAFSAEHILSEPCMQGG